MTLNVGQADQMTWQRDDGTAGDITGDWTFAEDENVYDITLDGDGSLLVTGEITTCDDDDDTSTAETITGESGNPVSMHGTWQEACVPDGEEGSSETTDLTIAGSTFTVVQRFWFSPCRRFLRDAERGRPAAFSGRFDPFRKRAFTTVRLEEGLHRSGQKGGF